MWLLLRAVPLIRCASRVATVPLPDVVASFGQLATPGRLAVGDVDMVARVGVRWWARVGGGLDSCLVRSLVLAALLRERGRLVVVIGFLARGLAELPDGHAWVTLNGVPVGRDAVCADDRFERVVQFDLGR